MILPDEDAPPGIVNDGTQKSKSSSALPQSRSRATRLQPFVGVSTRWAPFFTLQLSSSLPRTGSSPAIMKAATVAAGLISAQRSGSARGSGGIVGRKQSGGPCAGRTLSAHGFAGQPSSLMARPRARCLARSSTATATRRCASTRGPRRSERQPRATRPPLAPSPSTPTVRRPFFCAAHPYHRRVGLVDKVATAHLYRRGLTRAPALRDHRENPPRRCREAVGRAWGRRRRAAQALATWITLPRKTTSAVRTSPKAGPTFNSSSDRASQLRGALERGKRAAC